MPNPIERTLAALEQIRQGKMVVLVDDEDRENEGDVCMAAEKVTPEAINFMARHARGLVCLSLDGEMTDRLDLPMMVDQNRSTRSTAFTISIEARQGVSTGISAADRAHTILTAVSDQVTARDIVSPGHVFPLRSVPGGVLQRSGHTEGSVDLARLAGFRPAGVICEIMKDDGTMARYPDLLDFAKTHQLQVLSIADLIEYRLARERLVHCARSAEVVAPTGQLWNAHVYQVQVGRERQFLAFCYGNLSREPTLVRVHTSSVLGDSFQVRMGDRVHLLDAMTAIEKEGAGAILFLPAQPDPLTDIAFYMGEPVERAPGERDVVLREYGLGAQVLVDLGLAKIRVLTNRPRRIPSLEGYGLEIVEQLQVLPGGALREFPQQSKK